MLVYDLLASPDCLPDLLQGKLKIKGQDEAFLLSSFRLHTKAPTSLYSVINPKDNTKYLDFSVHAKLSKGELLYWDILYYSVCNNHTLYYQVSVLIFVLLLPFFASLPPLCFLSSVFHFHFCPFLVTIRYQKTDGRFGTTSFNHASLADGRDHHVMLHASGLQGGPTRLNIYVDCRLAHTLGDLPAAFGLLPPGPNKVALRILQSSGQVNKRFTVMIYAA